MKTFSSPTFACPGLEGVDLAGVFGCVLFPSSLTSEPVDSGFLFFFFRKIIFLTENFLCFLVAWLSLGIILVVSVVLERPFWNGEGEAADAGFTAEVLQLGPVLV